MNQMNCLDHPKRKAVAFVKNDWGYFPVCLECWNKMKILHNKIMHM